MTRGLRFWAVLAVLMAAGIGLGALFALFALAVR